MVSETINFRRNVEAGTGVRLAHRIIKAGRLTDAFIHWPDGCNAAVLVRVLLSSRSTGGIRQICPINNEYIATNNCNWEFTLDEEVLKGDDLLVDVINQGAEDHQITVVVTRWSEQPTQAEMVVVERKGRVEKFRQERRVGR